MSYIKNLEDVLEEERFGNKAKNLSIAKSLGVLIPRGIAISYEVFVHYLSYKSLSRDFIVELEENLQFLPSYVSVRSSSNLEDSTTRSFAGHFLSFLNVPKYDTVSRIKDIYEDCISRYISRFPSLLMGIIVQEMIKKDVSFGGVIFSKDIINQSTDYFLLELHKEGCENVVSGKGTPSLLRVAKDFIFYEYLNYQSNNAVVLGEEDIKEMQYLVKRLEEHFNVPLNIEVIKSDKLYCLQVRPIISN